MADGNGKKICPHLGSTRDRDVCWAFPHSKQACWSPGVPKEPRSAYAPLNLDLQKHWCLDERHAECPYYIPPEKRPPVQPRSQFTGATGRCPLLGTSGDAAVYFAYPSAQNVCYSRKARARRGWQQKYAKAAREAQTSYCLTDQYGQCPHFEEEAGPAGPGPRQTLPSRDFLLLEGRCPCLGTKRSQEVYRIYPSRENICYSQGAPARLPWRKPDSVPADVQGAYCLTRRYPECEFFVDRSSGPAGRSGTAEKESAERREEEEVGASRLTLLFRMIGAWIGALFQAFSRSAKMP